MRFLALVPDAFGGRCGIAKFNRDLLTALSGNPAVERIVALPRVMPDAPGQIPAKVEFDTSGLGGKLHYLFAVLCVALEGKRPTQIFCGHLNLLPAAFLAKLICRAPVVLMLHGVEAWQPPPSWLIRKLVGRVDAVVAVSEFTRRKFFSWASLRSAHSHVLPNSVDLKRFSPGPKNEALLDRFGLRGKTVLLTVARLSANERYKGIDEVLDVLPELVRELPQLTFVIVGEGDDRRRLQAKAAQLGLTVHVKFAGWVAHEEVPDYHRLADAYVMPGRGEGFGIVYLEALACGIPVVASLADASGEVVRACESAVVVDPLKPADIKAGILRALKQPKGKVSEAVNDFSQPRFAQRCAQVFSELDRQLARATGQKILVFRIGHLGDTTIALPAMWAVKAHYPDAHFTLLCDRHPGKTRVLAGDLLRGTGIFDAFESYVVGGSRWARPFRLAETVWRLRRQHFDTLVYLAPSSRHSDQVLRDRCFFELAGIREFIGMSNFPTLPVKVAGQPLGATLPESDLLLSRLVEDGLTVPPLGKGRLDLALGPAEEAELSGWLARNPAAQGRKWLGIGPGSKMPAKRWPEERFQEVVSQLIKKHDVWPVIFGGPEDAELANRLLAAWGRGSCGAGTLGLRAATAALRRCQLYLGNDTGTMHLAAAAGVPCVALFSSREWPGMWFPYGVRQKVFRTSIECEGCSLEVCAERNNECLNHITAGEVLASCDDLLKTVDGKP